MVVPPTPIIPRNNDRRIRPIRTGSDGIDNRRYPAWSLVGVYSTGMVGFWTTGDHPGHASQLVILNIRENLLVIYDHTLLPNRSGACGRIRRLRSRPTDMLHRVRSGPQIASEWSVITPCDLLRVKQVGKRGMVVARERL